MVGAVRMRRGVWALPRSSSGEAAQEAAKRGRSIFAARMIELGEIFTEENLAVVRSSAGMDPGMWNELIGRRSPIALQAGDPLILRRLF